MSLFLSDAEIANLLTEGKPLPEGWRKRLTLKPKRGHKERDLDLQGSDGSQFRLILRQADLNPLDFSVILAFSDPKSSQVFRLLRHNGKHEHTNKIEGETFYDFHIHRATERYQTQGFLEDTYAEVTDKYSDFEGALQLMIETAGFELPKSSQMDLFDAGGAA